MFVLVLSWDIFGTIVYWDYFNESN
jgi:hypothetical protein